MVDSRGASPSTVPRGRLPTAPDWWPLLLKQERLSLDILEDLKWWAVGWIDWRDLAEIWGELGRDGPSAGSTGNSPRDAEHRSPSPLHPPSPLEHTGPPDTQEWFTKPGGQHTFNPHEAVEHYTPEEFDEALAKGVGRVSAPAGRV